MSAMRDAAGAGTPGGVGKSKLIEDRETTKATLLAQALQLADAGLAVFPCMGNKKPACAHGLLEATTDFANVRRLFSGYRVELIGIRTGIESGVAVLDLDGKRGLAWRERERFALPPTVEVSTPRGGAHLWYLIPGGAAEPTTTASKIAIDVDTRGRGGYAIAWQPQKLVRAEMAIWPAWLTEALRPPPPVARAVRQPRIEVSGRYEAAALRAAIRRVASAPEGTRNTVLNVEAFALARLPNLDPSTIRHALTVAARHAGLDHKEIAATIASALNARAGVQ